ncbi:MAG: DUF6512 family protein [Promethearchaeota archaeon]
MELKRDNNYYILLKALVYLIIFSILHFAYDWSNENDIVGIFSGTDESVFQHMKIGFYSYSIVAMIEFLIYIKQIEKSERGKFFYSRLLSMILIPWFMMVLYSTAAMFFNEQPPYVFEIIYSILMGYITLLPVLMLEAWYDKFEFSYRVKILIIVLAVIMIVEFTVFTLNKPWHDIFTAP